MDKAIMPLPQCPAGHGEMHLVDVKKQTYEQRFCGTWYNCGQCGCSVLLTSPQLEAHLAEMRAKRGAISG